MLLGLFLSYTVFPFLFFLSISRYYVAGVFGLIGTVSLSVNRSLPVLQCRPLLIIIIIIIIIMMIALIIIQIIIILIIIICHFRF